MYTMNEWPKYYTGLHKNTAFVELEKDGTCIAIGKDGTRSNYNWIPSYDLHVRRELTKLEALSLLNPEACQPEYLSEIKTKTRIRLYMPTALNSSCRHNEIVVRENPGNPMLWKEIHCDSQGFYIEE